MKEKFNTKLREIQEKMNWGISDVVIKFDESLYTRVLKTIKLNNEEVEKLEMSKGIQLQKIP